VCFGVCGVGVQSEYSGVNCAAGCGCAVGKAGKIPPGAGGKACRGVRAQGLRGMPSEGWGVRSGRQEKSRRGRGKSLAWCAGEVRSRGFAVGQG
jgi:hypothetical protein